MELLIRLRAFANCFFRAQDLNKSFVVGAFQFSSDAADMMNIDTSQGFLICFPASKAQYFQIV